MAGAVFPALPDGPVCFLVAGLGLEVDFPALLNGISMLLVADLSAEAFSFALLGGASMLFSSCPQRYLWAMMLYVIYSVSSPESGEKGSLTHTIGLTCPGAGHPLR